MKLLSKGLVSKWLWCDLNPGLPDSKVYANTGPSMAISLQLPDQVAAAFQLCGPWFGMQVSEAAGLRLNVVFQLHVGIFMGASLGTQPLGRPVEATFRSLIQHTCIKYYYEQSHCALEGI